MLLLFLKPTHLFLGIGLAFLAYFLYKKITSPDGKDLNLSTLITDKVKLKLEILSLCVTILECTGLMSIAIDRGVDMINAIARYTAIGMLELIFTFLLFELSTKLLKVMVLRPYHTSTNKYGAIILSIPLFIAYVIVCTILLIVLSIPSLIILQMYFESIGALKLYYIPGFLPHQVLGIVNQAAEEMAMQPSDVVMDEFGLPTPELGAIVLILMNPVLNIILIPLSIGEINEAVIAELGKSKTPEEKSKDKPSESAADLSKQLSSSPDNKSKLHALFERLPKIDKSYDPTIIKSNLDKILGLDASDKSKVSPMITNKSQSIEDVCQILLDDIEGSVKSNKLDSDGILGIIDLMDEVQRLNKEKGEMYSKKDKAIKELAKLTDPTLIKDKTKEKDDYEKKEQNLNIVFNNHNSMLKSRKDTLKQNITSHRLL